MADLEFHGTSEERQRQVEQFLRRLSADYYGNGRVGTKDMTNAFIASFQATEKERDRAQAERHQENSEKLDALNLKLSEKNTATASKSLWWTVAGVCVAAASVAVAILAIVFTIKLAHVSSLRELPLFDELTRVMATVTTSNADAGRLSW